MSNVNWQNILTAGTLAYKAGYWSYARYKEWRRAVEGAKEQGRFLKAGLLERAIPNYDKPLPEVPIRGSKGESVLRVRDSGMSKGMRQSSCKIPAKYYDVFGSSAGTNTVTGGTGNWDANGVIQPSNASAPNWTQVTTGISAGVGGQQRNGNAVCLKSIFIRFRIHPNATLTSGEHLMRVLLVQDMIDVPSGAVPALSDILQASTPATGVMESPLNVSTFGRFVVLKDEVLRYRSIAACGVSPEHLDHYWMIKKREIMERKGQSDVLWDADGTTRGKGQIWMYAVSSQNVPTMGTNVITSALANQPGVSCWVRLRFTDSN